MKSKVCKLLSALIIAGGLTALSAPAEAFWSNGHWYYDGGRCCHPYVRTCYRPVCYRPVCYRPVCYRPCGCYVHRCGYVVHRCYHTCNVCA